MPPTTALPVPTSADVKNELAAIARSPVFSHSSRGSKFLEYLCNKVLLGETDHLKASTIAVEVFGRRSDFDESKDAIVRVEAHRLRKKLEKYYAEDGANSRIRIVLPSGRYIPEFYVVETGPPPVRKVPDAPVLPRRRTWLWLIPILLLAPIVTYFSVRQPVRARTLINPVPPVAIAPAAAEIRVLAGQTRSPYLDRRGRRWEPDRYFTGGTAEIGAKEFYGRPSDAGLFATMRTGEFSYDLPAREPKYELRLYWAEPIFRTANEINGGQNERRFNVFVNGQAVLSSFDVSADSGIAPVDVRSFKVSPDRDGMVHVRFTPAYGTPFLNGLELIPLPNGSAVPIRIRAHDLSFTDHEGNIWSPDDFYVGGRMAGHKELVSGTPDPDLYAGERYGNFNYQIPVPPGKFAVTLHFAETWFRPDSDGQDHGGKGDRIFDVYCNGNTLIKDLDLFAKAGPFRAVTRTFRGIRPNGQGKILLSFSPSKNYATVKAIEVVEEP